MILLFVKTVLFFGADVLLQTPLYMDRGSDGKLRRWGRSRWLCRKPGDFQTIKLNGLQVFALQVCSSLCPLEIWTRMASMVRSVRQKVPWFSAATWKRVLHAPCEAHHRQTSFLEGGIWGHARVQRQVIHFHANQREFSKAGSHELLQMQLKLEHQELFLWSTCIPRSPAVWAGDFWRLCPLGSSALCCPFGYKCKKCSQTYCQGSADSNASFKVWFDTNIFKAIIFCCSYQNILRLYLLLGQIKIYIHFYNSPT